MTTTFEILLPVWFLIIAGICKAVSDTLADHSSKSIFPASWDKAKSSSNKWKGGNPDRGEKFFGSSTFLVWLTDPWHLSNMLQYTCFILAIVSYWPVYGWLIDAILLKCIFTITFEVFYRWVLKKESTR